MVPLGLLDAIPLGLSKVTPFELIIFISSNESIDALIDGVITSSHRAGKHSTTVSLLMTLNRPWIVDSIVEPFRGDTDSGLQIPVLSGINGRARDSTVSTLSLLVHVADVSRPLSISVLTD